MFKEMGQMFSMLKNLPKLQANLAELQQKIGSIVAEGTSGGGMVTAKANGRFELVGLTLNEEVMKSNDKEMLEDLIIAAINQAIAKVRVSVAEETQKMAGDLGLPPGVNLPGLT
jgi:nucleoid-associated protein EbfC